MTDRLWPLGDAAAEDAPALVCPRCGSGRVGYGAPSGRQEETPFCRTCGLGGDLLEPSSRSWRHEEPCPACGSHELDDALRCAGCGVARLFRAAASPGWTRP